ncbi:hypothetical protein Bca52824_079567 [Brassica carinata]|uniref:HRDC domain-containing protein n=1 Tax=Brassica carinata TaxID=52824 RepID=A0A8X7PZY9_BRACI|nr:hypothetical protein Bca52824_079567 [Brassica carinata]
MKLNSVPAHVSSPHSNLNLEELQTTVLSRATSLSETALKVLLWERDKLTLEQRFIEDEIAKCDQRIKNIKGGFEAEVRIKKAQFTHTICGEEKSDAEDEEARESAAACLLTKLHQYTTAASDVLTEDHLSNPMLQKIITKIPRNKEELLQIDGLGKDKVSRYGDLLLETIETTIKEYYVTNKKGSME